MSEFKVGDRVYFGNTSDHDSGYGEVVAILEAEVPFPIVVKREDSNHETHFSADELEAVK